MLSRAGLVAIIWAALLAPAHAATQSDCLSLWKSADIDANGALTQEEDKSGYFSALANKPALAQPGTISRDEFIQFCVNDTFAGVQVGQEPAKVSPGPAASRDLGKGDLTPAKSALSESDAVES